MNISFTKKFETDNSKALGELYGIKNDIQELPINLLDPWENQPFRVLHDQSMDDLVDSIREEGQLSPIIVRMTTKGRYQILAGHRRTTACKQLGYHTIKAIIRDNCDDDLATRILVNSNLNQRQQLLPSEKAFAYKLLSERGSASETAREHKETRQNIHRYIRLTSLEASLLKMVDSETLSIKNGAELSYLSKGSQLTVMEVVKEYEYTLTFDDCKALRTVFEEQNLLNKESVLRTLDLLPEEEHPEEWMESVDEEPTERDEQMYERLQKLRTKAKTLTPEMIAVPAASFLTQARELSPKDYAKIIGVHRRILKHMRLLEGLLIDATPPFPTNQEGE